MPILAALAAALLAGAAAPPTATPAPPTGDVRVEGDVTYEPGTGLLLVQNGAVFRRGDVVLRARSASYDPATGEVRATGGVTLSDRTRFIAADGIRVVLDGPFDAEGVVAFVKGVPTDLSSAGTVEEARRAGPNQLSFSGTRLHGDARGRFVLEGARLTLCDCPGGCAPSWEVTARRANVVPGVRATLSWPVLRITPRFLFVDHPVPVLAFPWLYIPLGERQTGLLLPELLSTGSTGLTIAEPVFVTLGRSADATVTPTYAFGRSRAGVANGDPAVRGPGARVELRWAPAEAAEGQVQLAWVDDLDAERGGESGGRFALTGRHGQRLSDRTSLAAALRLYGDPVWVRDLTSDVLAREAPYARSDVLLSRRSDALVLEVGASYLEPLRPYGYCVDTGAAPPTPGCSPGLVETRDDFGALGSRQRVASRWPSAAATLLPVGLGPLRVSGRAGFARFAPVASAVDLSGRAAADRADLRAEVAVPLVLGEALSVTPYARGAATAYAFEADAIAPSATTAAGWGVGGVAIATEVSRRFGELRHAIAPRLEWRAGTAVAGDALPWPSYDPFDRSASGLLSAAPPGAWQQLRAAVETRLSRGGKDLLRLELGQDYDARLGRFAETFAGADAAWGPLGASASARFLAIDGRPIAAPALANAVPSAVLDRFTEVRAAATLSDRRGDLLRAGFLSVGPGGSGTLIAGLDPLFDLRPGAVGSTGSASAGARIVAGGATLGYDVLFPGRPQMVPGCTPGAPDRQVGGWEIQQQTATASWDSPCRCFRIAALVRHNDCGEWHYSATLDLSHLVEPRSTR